MSTTEHSRLPWSYEMYELSTGDSAIVYDARGLGVPGMSHLNEEDARLIITAVNSHATLLAAAKMAKDEIAPIPFTEESRAIWLSLQAAIAAAEEPAT